MPARVEPKAISDNRQRRRNTDAREQEHHHRHGQRSQKAGGEPSQERALLGHPAILQITSLALNEILPEVFTTGPGRFEEMWP
jgi:hypothetical protein